MKPRITQGWGMVWIGTWVSLHGWKCTGDGITEWSATPAAAYHRWAGEVARREVDAMFVEPPKPTLWQKFRRFKWWPDEVGNWT